MMRIQKSASREKVDGLHNLRGLRRRRTQRLKPELDRMEARVVPAVDITSFNLATGVVVFTGDRRGTNQDSLQLSETVVGPDIFLTHNLIGGGGNGKYADAMDIDPGNGIARLKIGIGSAPQITANLGSNRDILTLANSWSFNHKLVYNGGTGTDRLNGTNANLSWNLTGTSSSGYDGNVINTSKLTFTSLNEIGGSTGTDTLVGRNLTTNWTLGATKTYNDGGGVLTVSGIDTYQGGTGVDTFYLNASAAGTLRGGLGADRFISGDGISWTGAILGEGGSDTLDLSGWTSGLNVALTATTADGFSGTLPEVSGGFSGIDLINAGEGNDTISGLNSGATWGMDDTPTYTVGGSVLGFQWFESIEGGTGSDTFNLVGDGLLMVNATMRGGAGADQFVFQDGVFVVGDLEGGADMDTLNYSNTSAGIYVGLFNMGDVTGYSGYEYLGITGMFTGMDSLIGSAGFDVLVGEDASSTWAINTVRTYKRDDLANTLVFSSFEELQGGSDADFFDVWIDPACDLRGGAGDDQFWFRDGAASTGQLIGETGQDSLDLSLYNSARAIVLSSTAADGFAGSDGVSAGFSGMDTVIGGSGADSLTGLASGTWNLDTEQTYVSGGGTLTFFSFQDLHGGSGIDFFDVRISTEANLHGQGSNDSFTFANGAVLTGDVVGGPGADLLDLSADTGGVAVSLTTAAAHGFGGTSTATTGFSGLDEIRAGSGSDTLSGLASGTWNLASAQTYVSSGSTLLFSGFQTLQGGSGIDVYNVITSTPANLSGGNGNDQFVFSDGAVLAGSITGGSGTDTLNASAYTAPVNISLLGNGVNGFSGTGTLATGFSAVDMILGGSAGDTLTGLATGNWNLGAVQTYVSGGSTLTFSSFQNLNGGSGVDAFHVMTSTTANLSGNGGNDQFVFSDGSVLSGTITGGSGMDTMNMGAYTTGVTVTLAGASAHGYSGTASVATAFSLIDSIVGGAAADTLHGLSSGTWNLSITQTYVSSGITLNFSSFQSLQGGSGVDTFMVSVSSTTDLAGNGGDDLFLFADGAMLSGAAAGGAGSDHLNMSAFTSNVSVVLTGSDGTGFQGTSTGATSFSGMDTLTAGSGANNQITGQDTASTWTVSGAGSTYDNGTHLLGISTFQTFRGGAAIDSFQVIASATAHLFGGGGADLFHFSDGVELTGQIAGEAGSDTLDLGSQTGASHTMLTGVHATNGFAGETTVQTEGSGFSGIDAITGGTATGDVLTGLDADAAWLLSGSYQYQTSGSTLNFTGYEVLMGGSGADQFQIGEAVDCDLSGGDGNDVFMLTTATAAVGGIVDGDDGIDALDYSAYTSDVSVNLASFTATGVTAFSGIEEFVGGSGMDSLTAFSQVNTWNITATNEGTISGLESTSFRSFENLTGGSGADTFSFAEGVGITGTLQGGSGNDSMNFSAYGASHGVTMNVGMNNGGTISSLGVGFSFNSVEGFTGGWGDDTIALGAGRALSGSISGGSGVDTLSYAAYTTTVRVNLSTGAAIGIASGGTGGVAGFENVIGGSGSDVVIGDGAANVLTGGGGNDVLVGNDGTDSLHGEAGRDIVIGGNGADVIDGGADEDLLVGGRTSHDYNLAALNALMAEWGRTDASYATRIAHLNGTLPNGRNGTRLLNASTIFDDAGAVDQLTGSTETDWFIHFVTDLVTDHDAGTETRTIL